MRSRSSFIGILMIVALMTTAVGVRSQDKDDNSGIKVDPASKARIQYLQGEWSFGSIPQGYIYYHNFPLVNVGTDTLVITRVKPTCGCTAAPLSNDHVAPGDTAEISVSFNTARLNGRVKKFVNVDCNDPINPYYRITFDAHINNPDQMITSDPVYADFGDFESGEEAKADLELKNNSSSPMELVIVDKPPDDILKARIKKTKLSDGKTTKLEISIKADLEPGPFASTITIQDKNNPDSRMSIPIKGNVIE